MSYVSSRICNLFNSAIIGSALWASSLHAQEPEQPPPPELPTTTENIADALTPVNIFTPPVTLPETNTPQYHLASANDYTSLGFYFRNTYTSEPTYWNSQERIEKLKDRFIKFSDMSYEFPQTHFMPVRETMIFVEKPDLLFISRLSPEQKIHIDLLKKINATPTGKALLKIAAENDVIIAVDNDVKDILGAFYSDPNVASYELKDSQHNDEKTLYDDEKVFAGLLKTVIEEIAHSVQFAKGALLSSLDTDVYLFHAKIWNNSVEAQAKLMTAMVIVELEDMSLLGASLRNDYLDTMVKNIVKIHLKHGVEHVQNNPELLLPVYLSFFQSQKCMDAYSDLNQNFINQNFTGKKPVEWALYTKTFGSLPGISKNMFNQNCTSLGEIADYIHSDAQMTGWIRHCKVAVAEGRKEPKWVRYPNGYFSIVPNLPAPPEPATPQH